MTEVQRAMTYDERQAVIVLRKAILRKPWIANELLRDMPREVATTALLSVRDKKPSSNTAYGVTTPGEPHVR